MFKICLFPKAVLLFFPPYSAARKIKKSPFQQDKRAYSGCSKGILFVLASLLKLILPQEQ